MNKLCESVSVSPALSFRIENQTKSNQASDELAHSALGCRRTSRKALSKMEVRPLARKRSFEGSPVMSSSDKSVTWEV